ncbi:MAG: type IV secretion system DNA-binding domain-containing protein [Acidobacteria bacterium]|nr:type IV secretion system DNA-binding domain-containing protein [Acidobacteriota bacterium]
MSQPQNPQNDISFFAETNFRDEQKAFGIKQADRRYHTYIIGKTGTGKSTLLETLIQQDLLAGRGFALLDPHGDLVRSVLDRIPEERRDDLIYFDVTNSAQPLGFNPLESVSPAWRSLAAGLLDVFKKMWADSWGPRLEYILRNALLALFDQPKATLADILRMLNDEKFRRSVVESTGNAQVRDFWLKEFQNYPARFQIEAISPIQNKVGAFLSNPVLNRILTQERSAFKLRRIMDEGKILLVNLSKGQLGEDTAGLLGSLLVSRIGLAALSRSNIPESERRDFYLYLDEFHSFTTLSLTTMLSELRKYHVGLILANQYLAQIDEKIRDAILGNAGTIISFRLGLLDAEILAREFYPEISIQDLMNLPNYHIYLKMIIDGQVSHPFSAQTLQPKGEETDESQG